MAGCVSGLEEQGFPVLAAMVGVFTLGAPTLLIVALLYVLVPLLRGRRLPWALALCRAIHEARRWNMVEVFLLGVLVSLLKLKYFPADPEHRVPVLIKIDPNLLLDQTESNASIATAQALIAQSVEKGLRASLKSGSLLTGQLFVDLDFQKDVSPATVASVGSYEVLPTIPAAGLDDPDSSLNNTLKNAEKITAELSGNKDIGGTLHNLKETSAQLNTTVADLSAQFKKIGQNLTDASDTVKRQPWRLIWPSTKKYDGESHIVPPKPQAIIFFYKALEINLPLQRHRTTTARSESL